MCTHIYIYIYIRRRRCAWGEGCSAAHVVVVDLREDVREEHRVPHLQTAACTAPTHSIVCRAHTQQRESTHRRIGVIGAAAGLPRPCSRGRSSARPANEKERGACQTSRVNRSGEAERPARAFLCACSLPSRRRGYRLEMKGVKQREINKAME